MIRNTTHHAAKKKIPVPSFILRRKNRNGHLTISSYVLMIFFAIILFQGSISVLVRFTRPDKLGELLGSEVSLVKNKQEYILWSHKEIHFRECREHMLRNETWGAERGPYVDKVGVKTILQRWDKEFLGGRLLDDTKVGGLELKIPKTLAFYTRDNYTEFTSDVMKSIPQPYVIKMSHYTGGVARVHNNTYHCLKNCLVHNQAPMSLNDPKAFDNAWEQHMLTNLVPKFNTKEKQYHFAIPSIIIEEDILINNKDIKKDVTWWFLSGGVPIFAKYQCENNDPPEKQKYGRQAYRFGVKEHAWVSTNFQPLPMGVLGTRGNCEELGIRPKTWDRQRKIVETLGPYLPEGVVRLDLYGGDENDVYFSEFTFTSAACEWSMRPAVVEGLMYAVHHGSISKKDAIQPEYIESVVGDSSWVLVSLLERNQEDYRKKKRKSGAYPSPVDLCLNMVDMDSKNRDEVCDAQLFQMCIAETRKVVRHSSRYVVWDGNNDTSRIESFGDGIRRSVDSIMDQTRKWSTVEDVRDHIIKVTEDRKDLSHDTGTTG